MAASIIVVVAAIGIIVGLINQTGIGNDFGRLLSSLTGDSIFVILLITAVGALILGMGLPPGATYFLIILSIGNSMAQLDVPLLTIHLFVVYYAVMSTVTPPVALAAYAAAPIAGAHPIRTGFDASRLSAAGFIIPFIFYYHPAVLYKLQADFCLD